MVVGVIVGESVVVAGSVVVVVIVVGEGYSR